MRTIEDFTCERCDAKVCGDGYTNHCPRCLWSKHVDENPGDRAAVCGGAMEPASISVSSGGIYRILHQCLACGFIRAQEAAREDSAERLIELSTYPFAEDSGSLFSQG